ncbi:hypothetical protein [Lentzea albidocapillata]|uniref:Uncharacterized protein n=1 Tax=Lentzea albidocapillata TaxID=40571 RepID=A0A1W2CC34_9PSEU|nr:hypothetical protein [Lentzea albidocapillata]SMC82740.1 hypothetical protein SAMN05660733_01909 [Lentzea albidocapillata]
MKKATLALLLLLLAACSKPEAQPQVASISTPPSSAAPTSASQEQRPRERLDMTPEDLEALNVPHDQCMAGLGLDRKGRAAEGSGRPQPTKEELDKALQACESKDPLPPWEKDSTNPEAVDFANRVVQCLRGKGVRYVEVHNEPGSEMISYALGGPNNDAASISLGLEHAKACEIASSKK